MLSIVSTPIGNLADFSGRGVEVLSSCQVVLAERPRYSQRLLNHYGIKCKLWQYSQHTSDYDRERFIQKMKEGQHFALISDAGTPGISDPGAKLLSQAAEAGVVLQPVPGASAGLVALICSGFSLERFTFLGYLPQSKSRQYKMISEVLKWGPVVFYESPHRLLKTLRNFRQKLDGRLMVANDLTKKFEFFYRGSLEQVIGKLEKQSLRGEWVVVLEGLRSFG